jgi:hypothetical protein
MSATPITGERIEMREPWGFGWLPAVVTRVATVVTADVGDTVFVSASGVDEEGTIVGPHVTSFWDGPCFRREEPSR